MHDVLIVSVPLLTILAGLFFNNRAISELKSEIKDIRAEINEFRSETRARFDRVDDRLVDIYRIIGNTRVVCRLWSGSGKRLSC